MAKHKPPTTKLWPTSYQHYFEICHLIDLYAHYVLQYTHRTTYSRLPYDNYRAINDRNAFYKTHEYLKELGCPPEVYLEGVFTKFTPAKGREYPIPNTLIYYSFLVMEYLKMAKISYGNFYQIPDGVEDDMAKQVGRGLINYFRLKEFIPTEVEMDSEEYLITNYVGSFEDYFVVSNLSVFMKYCEDKKYISETFDKRTAGIESKLEHFQACFRDYERLTEMKERITKYIADKLNTNSRNLPDLLSEIQRGLEEVKYRV